jgi:hypothetical protein
VVVATTFIITVVVSGICAAQLWCTTLDVTSCAIT